MRSLTGGLLTVLMTASLLVLSAAPASADVATCQRSGDTLTWDDVSADRDRYHVRAFTDQNRSRWITKVTGQLSFDVSAHLDKSPIDTFGINYRENGSLIKITCVDADQPGPELPPAEPICYHDRDFGHLYWGSVLAEIDDFNIRVVRPNGSSKWVATSPPARKTAESSPAIVGNEIAVNDNNADYLVRYRYFDADGNRTRVDIACQDGPELPIAPGAVFPCQQWGSLLMVFISPETVDGQFYVQTWEPGNIRTDVASVAISDGPYTSMVIDEVDPTYLVEFDTGPSRQFVFCSDRLN